MAGCVSRPWRANAVRRSQHAIYADLITTAAVTFFALSNNFSNAVCLDDADPYPHVVRTRDTGAICRAIAKRDYPVDRHCVQWVRERLQQPPIGLPQQSLHAGTHSG